jgi:L-ribulokinase
MYSDAWHGLPDRRFLQSLDPALAGKGVALYSHAHGTDTAAGRLAPAWAKKLGLRAGIPIANAGLDCQAGAIGSGVGAGTLVKIIGTSACDCAALPGRDGAPEIPGICGSVPEAVLPDHVAIEAGQAAVGDIFRWWVEEICHGDARTHETLASEAAQLAPGASGLLALDWHNGNRNVLCDPLLSGLLVGCTLHTSRAEIYRSLIEGTAFGARMILERLRQCGVPVKRVVSAGGIAEKNALLMQIYADVLGCRVEIAASTQACALGSAIAASVVAGVHADFAAAQRAMTRLKAGGFRPNAAAGKTYDRLFRQYQRLHDAFSAGREAQSVSSVMKDLFALRAAARKQAPHHPGGADGARVAGRLRHSGRT